MKRVLKWTVAVDDADHPIGWGKVLHVDALQPHELLVWTEELDAGGDGSRRPARVYGTGQVLPDDAEHLGSAVTLDGALVWHLFTVPGGTDGT